MRYLYDKTEKIILEYDSELFEHPHLSTGNKVISARKGDAIGPLHPGHYLIYENTGASEKRIRYLGIAPDHASFFSSPSRRSPRTTSTASPMRNASPSTTASHPTSSTIPLSADSNRTTATQSTPSSEAPKHLFRKNASPNGCGSSTHGSSPKDSPSCADSQPTIPRPRSSAR